MPAGTWIPATSEQLEWIAMLVENCRSSRRATALTSCPAAKPTSHSDDVLWVAAKLRGVPKKTLETMRVLLTTIKTTAVHTSTMIG